MDVVYLQEDEEWEEFNAHKRHTYKASNTVFVKKRSVNLMHLEKPHTGVVNYEHAGNFSLNTRGTCMGICNINASNRTARLRFFKLACNVVYDLHPTIELPLLLYLIETDVCIDLNVLYINDKDPDPDPDPILSWNEINYTQEVCDALKYYFPYFSVNYEGNAFMYTLKYNENTLVDICEHANSNYSEFPLIPSKTYPHLWSLYDAIKCHTFILPWDSPLSSIYKENEFLEIIVRQKRAAVIRRIALSRIWDYFSCSSTCSLFSRIQKLPDELIMIILTHLVDSASQHYMLGFILEKKSKKICLTNKFRNASQ